MSKIALSNEQVQQGFLKLLSQTDQYPSISIEGMRTVPKMQFIPKFVGIVLDDSGKIERTPITNEKFKNLQSTYITAVIDKSEGMLPNLLHIPIMKNQAERLYDLLLKAGLDMQKNNGIFPEFNYEGEAIEVGDIEFERGFKIPNKNTTSGYSEDAQGNIVVAYQRPYIFFKDFKGNNLTTLMRREARNLETKGHFVGSEPVDQIPPTTQNTAQTN